MSQAQTITVHQLAGRDDQACIDVVDVRTPLEYREVHAVAARNIPLDSLDPCAVMSKRNGSADEPLYVICRSGARAAKAQKKFIAAGFANVINVEGGTEAWVSAGLPIVRGKKSMSLERQVRVATGSIVLTGALLALFVHPSFASISAMVGAGLVFAGLTNSCAMGMLLAKMPWNRHVGRACSV